MILRIALLSVIFSLISIASNAEQIRKVTFQELPVLVKEKNSNVEAARSFLMAQEKRTGYFARSLLPRLSAYGGTEQIRSNWSMDAGLDYWRAEAAINIFRGGADWLESKIRNENVELAKTDANIEFQTELKEARSIYWKLLATEKRLTDHADALENNEKNLKSARRRAGAGVATAADTTQFELHQIELQQEVKKLELEQDLLRNRLGVAAGLDGHENIRIEADFPKISAQRAQFTEFTPDKNLDLKSFKSRANIENFRSSQSARWWLPKVDLYAAYGVPSVSQDYTRAIRRETDWTVGARVSLDFGTGIESAIEASAKSYEAIALESRREHRFREVLAADHELRHDIKVLTELIEIAEKNVDKGRLLLRYTQSEYERGVKNGPDLLGAFQKYYELREKRTELYLEYYNSQLELMDLLAQSE